MAGEVATVAGETPSQGLPHYEGAEHQEQQQKVAGPTAEIETSDRAAAATDSVQMKSQGKNIFINHKKMDRNWVRQEYFCAYQPKNEASIQICNENDDTGEFRRIGKCFVDWATAFVGAGNTF